MQPDRAKRWKPCYLGTQRGGVIFPGREFSESRPLSQCGERRDEGPSGRGGEKWGGARRGGPDLTLLRVYVLVSLEQPKLVLVHTGRGFRRKYINTSKKWQCNVNVSVSLKQPKLVSTLAVALDINT